MDTIVTVTQAAESYDLTTLEAVKTELDITGNASDAKLSRWITAASASFANECGVVFPVETISEQIRFTDVGDRYVARRECLPLSRWPVVSITSVTEDNSPALDPSCYEVDKDAGKLYRLNASGYREYWVRSRITVAYQGGYETIPADVADAVITMMRHRWFSTGRDPSLRSLQIFDVSTETYWVGGAGDVGDLPPDVAAVAGRYRQVRV